MINKLLNKIGLEISKKKQRVNKTKNYGYSFCKTIANANYSPWFDDENFIEVYNSIKSSTLVDVYRCYELWEIAKTSITNFPNASLLEIGVWRGGTASIIGKQLFSNKATVNFYLADTFKGVVKASEIDSIYSGGEHNDTSLLSVKNLVNSYYNNCIILEGIFPDETAHFIDEDEKFSLCHIDVDVYESAKDIINWIWEKLEVGGILVFDDYGFSSCEGITKLVNEQKKLKNRIVIHNLNGHAIIIKI